MSSSRIAVVTALDTLQWLAVSLWLGLTAALVILPSGLCAARSAGVLVAALAQIGTLGACAEVCGLVMVGAQFLQRRRYQRIRALYIADGLRQLLTLCALFLAEYGYRSLLPEMRGALTAHNGQGVQSLLDQWILVARIQIPLLITIVALSSWLGLPRSVRN